MIRNRDTDKDSDTDRQGQIARRRQRISSTCSDGSLRVVDTICHVGSLLYITWLHTRWPYDVAICDVAICRMAT